jgi:hypothetical protein
LCKKEKEKKKEKHKLYCWKEIGDQGGIDKGIDTINRTKNTVWPFATANTVKT